MTQDLGFILENWGTISCAAYTLSLVAIGFAVMEKTSIWNKILNIFIILSLPLIGCAFYLFVRLYKKHKAKSSNAVPPTFV